MDGIGVVRLSCELAGVSFEGIIFFRFRLSNEKFGEVLVVVVDDAAEVDICIKQRIDAGSVEFNRKLGIAG